MYVHHPIPFGLDDFHLNGIYAASGAHVQAVTVTADLRGRSFHDFCTFGSAAALIFPSVFFSCSGHGSGTTAATLQSLAAFGMAYPARRPAGAAREHGLHRRPDGPSTFLIGCLPTHAQAGSLARALLIALRVPGSVGGR